MNAIVRRKNQSPKKNKGPQEPTEKAVEKRHAGDGLNVSTKLTLGAMPKLALSWGVWPRFWGSTLLVFHNISEFCPNDDPHDLREHGKLIIETRRNDNKSLFLEEGTHFFTLVLRRKRWFKWFLEWRSQPLRFSIDVPSAKLPLSRLNDELEFGELQHRSVLRPIQQVTELNQAQVNLIYSEKKLEALEDPNAKDNRTANTNPIIAEQLKPVDDMLDASLAKMTKTEELNNHSGFKKLSPEEQAKILNELESRLHPSEISARRRA